MSLSRGTSVFIWKASPAISTRHSCCFTTALTKPDFSPATLQAAKAALSAKIAQNQRLALSVGIDMLNRAFYQDSDAGLPPYGMPQTIAGFDPADVRAFYTEHYRRGDAVISAIGDTAGAAGANFSVACRRLG